MSGDIASLLDSFTCVLILEGLTPIITQSALTLTSSATMGALDDLLQAFSLQTLWVAATIVLAGLVWLGIYKITHKKSSEFPSPPVVPGLPLIGNLHQLHEKKPHKTFAKWAEIYGPVYSIKAGASTIVVINSTDVAKEAMVSKFSSISAWSFSTPTKIVSENCSTVATSDYTDFHRATKKILITGFSGANAQKRFRIHRDTMMNNMLHKLHTLKRNNHDNAINIKDVIKNELFGLALKQSFGKDLECSIYIEDLQMELSKDEIFDVLVDAMARASIDVDWRDFFPYLRWVPNKNIETKIHQATKRRNAVMKTLFNEHKKRFFSGQVVDSFIDFLLLNEDSKSFTDNQLCMLIWEPTTESSDTTIVTIEWAMTELARNKHCQDLLYKEIQSVCGSNKITEDDLPRLPYLNAIFHETLRYHSPAPLLPLKYVHEDTQLGGYHIQAGTEIAINIYGCNMNKKQWDEPEKWKPERFMDNKYDAVDLYKTMSFGLGKRVCAGSQQAMTISCMTIGTFIQEFEWSLEEGQNDDIDKHSLTNHRLHKLRVFITQRLHKEGCA